jgi:hypothetical protein
MGTPLSFLTPYWSGADMMRLHLESIRRFHPDAPILISARDCDRAEMEDYRRHFNVRYWLDDCDYTNAYLRLLTRCPTPLACIVDHDTILLSSVQPLAERVADAEIDLVGVEERIRMPQSVGSLNLDADGWLRYAPHCTASNFLLFDWRAFEARWGLRGIFGTPQRGAKHFDFDYGISQRLRRHFYLRPYHAPRYGLGNLLRAGDVSLAWHQWYGSYRTRLDGPGVSSDLATLARDGEAAFLADYPNLDLDHLSPAWAPGMEPAFTSTATPALGRWRREAGYTLRAWKAQLHVAVESRTTRDADRA